MAYALLAEGSEGPGKQYDDHDSSASDSDPFLEKNTPLQPHQPFYRRYLRSIVLHTALCTFNLVFCLVIWHWARKDCPFGVYGPGLVYSKLNP